MASLRPPDPSGSTEDVPVRDEDPPRASSLCVNGHGMAVEFTFCPECGGTRAGAGTRGAVSHEGPAPGTGRPSLPPVTVDQWGFLDRPYLEACVPVLTRLSLDNMRSNRAGMAEDGRQLLQIAEDVERLVPPPADPEIAAASDLCTRLLKQVARACIDQLTRPDAPLIQHLLEQHTAQLSVLHGLVHEWNRSHSSDTGEETAVPPPTLDPSATLACADASAGLATEQGQPAHPVAGTDAPSGPRPTMKGGVVVIGGQAVCSSCGGTFFIPRRKTCTKLVFGLVSLVGRPQHIECVACGRLYKRPNR